MQQKRYLVALCSGFAIAQVPVTASCGKVNYFRVRHDTRSISDRAKEFAELVGSCY
jgi:hypothetical protein